MMISRLVPRQVMIFLSFTFLLITAFLIQTTIWFELLGTTPSPNLWMPVFVYLMSNRESTQRILWFLFFYFLFLTCSVVVPLHFFVSISATFFILHFIQSRFSTLSIFDLVALSLGAIVTCPLIYALMGAFTGVGFQFDLLHHIGSLILSFPLIPAVLMICRKIDKTFDPLNSSDNLVMEL